MTERFHLEGKLPLGPEDHATWHSQIRDDIDGISAAPDGRLRTAMFGDWTRALGGTLPDDLAAQLRTDLDGLRARYMNEVDWDGPVRAAEALV